VIPAIVPFRIKKKSIEILNQRLLPHTVDWVSCKSMKDVFVSIREMHVRGAPAIGIVAAYGYVFGALKLMKKNFSPKLDEVTALKEYLDSARPTAVNLMWATTRMEQIFTKLLAEKADMGAIKETLFLEAAAIHREDEESCSRMSHAGADYIASKWPGKKLRILTHCNTGALATGGIGTALGVIRILHQRGLVEVIYADETRPYLQGARLTAYELKVEKIPMYLIADSMAGFLMKQGKVDLVITGADRITKRGDVANKIGTFPLSVLAKEHGIPFYVAAPESTFDREMEHGDSIPIEERPAYEVLEIQGKKVAPDVPVLNYSFDVTPAENIEAIFHDGSDKVFRSAKL